MQGRLSSASHWYARARCALSCCTLVIATLVVLAGASPTSASGPAALVKDINPGPQGFYDSTSTDPLTNQMIDVGGKLFFVAIDGAHGVEPWVSDGTASGTKLLKDVSADNGYPWYFVNWNSRLFFAVGNGAASGLWKSDGTTGGTVLVKALGAPSTP